MMWEAVTPLQAGKGMIDPPQRWVLTLITPSVQATIEVKLCEFEILQEPAKCTHEPTV
jgi:hypothetical protein